MCSSSYPVSNEGTGSRTVRRDRSFGDGFVDVPRAVAPGGVVVRDRLDVSIPQVVLAVLAVSVLVGLLAALSTSSAAFSAYNSDWEGTSELRSTADLAGATVTVVHDTESYRDVSPEGTVAFVLAPESSYGPQDLARVREFVRRGGLLVVAGDYGPETNQLLRGLGATARLDGRPLYDLQSNYRTGGMPVAPEVANRSHVAGVESLTLNYGTAVRPNDATVLVNTSEYAYLDANRNGALDGDEGLGPRPVVTVERAGAGRIVTVGDPSVFINAMIDRTDNRQFVRALASGRDRLLLDYSHTGSLPPLVLAVLLVRDSAAIQFGIGVLAVGALTVGSRRPGTVSRLVGAVSRPWSDGPPTRDDRTRDRSEDAGFPSSELAAHLERHHPDWDRERVECVVSALERRRDR
jgi:hypothetical protein